MNGSSNPAFDWEEQMPFPSKEEIEESDKARYSRSPYLCGWVQCGRERRYDAISIEIRADHLPRATYCSAANFFLDYGALEKRYKRVYTEAIGGYCGLQHNLEEGSYNAILSFWDVFCEDEKGNVTKIRARQIYPEKTPGKGSFSGEGTGANAIVPYLWRAGQWYTVTLFISRLPSGSSAVELRIRDGDTNEETLISKFDLGIPDVTFKGNFAFFLENFDPSCAGEVRTMAVRNAFVRDPDGAWRSAARSVCRSHRKEFRGSYRIFKRKNAVCLVTTGVPGKTPFEESDVRIDLDQA